MPWRHFTECQFADPITWQESSLLKNVFIDQPLNLDMDTYLASN